MRMALVFPLILSSDRLRPQLETVLFIDRHPCRNASQESYEIGIAGIARIGDNYLLAPLQESGEDQHHGRRGAGGHHHLLGLYRNAIGLLVMPAMASRSSRSPRLWV